MLRPNTTASPQYQRLPFTHNAVQAFLTVNHQTKPCVKPNQLTLKSQQSLEKLRQNQLSFLKKKPSQDEAAMARPKHQHQQSVKGEPMPDRMTASRATPADLQLTPNTRLRAQQLYSRAPNQASSPNLNLRLTEYSSLQSTSTKRFMHNPTGSMNVATLQQQLSQLNRRADAALGQQRTPTKYINSTEHNKSRSVVESKENDFASSNSTQESRLHLQQNSSPIVSESIGSQGKAMCSVHHEKKAKYVNESNGHYHCNKCAVQFARMQINLREIPPSTSMSLPINEQEYKEQELRQFMDDLESLHHDRVPSILKSQTSQVKLFYQGQVHQCETVFRQMQSTLQQAFNRAHTALTSEMQTNLDKMNSLNSSMAVSFAELDTMRKDVQSNWTKIVEGVDLGGFRMAMSGYRERLQFLGTQMAALNNQQIQMMSMPPADTSSVGNTISECFSLLNSTLPLIPTELRQRTEPISKPEIIRTQPTPPKVTPPKVDSFTPKSRVKTDIEHPTTNFFQYFFNNQEHMVESVESCRAVASNSVHTNPIYVSFENRDFFHMEKPKPQEEIMVLQSYHGSEVVSEEDEKSCHSTPHSPASGQLKSQYERVTTTQQVKQLPEQQRSKQTFRTLFETQPEEEQKVSPSTSDKFKTFLHKVNTNQSKTQQFYQNIWPKPQSPRYDDSEDEDHEVQTVFQSRELGSQKKWHSSAKRGNELSVPSDSSHSSDQKSNQRDPYQKTLFCSPTFKNDDLNVSQSDQD